LYQCETNNKEKTYITANLIHYHRRINTTLRSKNSNIISPTRTRVKLLKSHSHALEEVRAAIPPVEILGDDRVMGRRVDLAAPALEDLRARERLHEEKPHCRSADPSQPQPQPQP
ncbi:unnamed protein product, partial [Musa hybrid cultivar]